MCVHDPGTRGKLLGKLVFATLATLLPGPAAAAQTSGCVWEARTPAPMGRIGGSAAVVGGKVHVFGGFFNQALRATEQVHVYDPGTDTWTRLADMPVKLTHASVAVDGQTVWILGGFRGNEPGTVIADVYRYDVATDSWSHGPDLPAPRGSGGAARLGRELHYYGGVASDRETDQADHFVLDLDDPAAGWSVGPPLPVPRNHFGSIALNGKAYAIGGQFRHDEDPEDVDRVHAFDPVTQLWTEVARLPFPRSHTEPGTFVMAGKLVIAGGRANTNFNPTLPDVTAYDPLTDTWSALPPLPAGLLAPVVQAYGDRIFLSGGGTPLNVPQVATYTRAQSAALGEELRLNAGGSPYVSAVDAEEWCSDLGAIGGQSYTNGNVTAIAGTDEDELYLSERSGTNQSPTYFGYRLPVPDGLYRVRLHFAEIYWGAPGGGPGGAGRRVFDVTLETLPVLRQLDINAEVGPMTALVYMFDVRVADQALDLDFLASVDRPKVSGIEIAPLADGAFENYCIAAQNSVGPGARISFLGNISVADNHFDLSAGAAPPLVSALFIQGVHRVLVPLGAGIRCVGGAVFRLTPLSSTDHAGWTTHTLDLTSPPQPAGTILPGSTWHFQLWYRDGQLSNLTDGLTVVFMP